MPGPASCEHRELLVARVARGDGSQQHEQVTLGVERRRDVAHHLVGRLDGARPNLPTCLGGHPPGLRIEPGQVTRLDQHCGAVSEGIDDGRR